MNELKSCPFCGKKPDPDDLDTLYPTGTGWKYDVELQMNTYHSFSEVPPEQWCYGMNCTNYSCNAQIIGNSKEDAIEKWNRRVTNES